MISKSFFESLECVAYDRGLDMSDVLKKVEFAISVAAKDEYTGDIQFDWDWEKKKIKVTEYKYVVSEIDPEGPKGQILVEEAQEIYGKCKAGRVFKQEIKLDSFKRKSASKFKQALTSGLKELEREEALKFFEEKVGDIITGKIISVQNGFITFNVGKETEAHMPEKEALEGEIYNVGDEKKLFLTKVEKTTKGPKLYLSRSNKEIVKRLFEMTIPEVANGDIEIMGIARDPGSRTKIGVMAINNNMDPKGACVGSGGLRIKSINEVLNNEKIDIFTWKTNPIDLIAQALLPAKVVSVMADEKAKKALVIVKDDQYSLAIGRNGQNARLAAYAINWKIDIKKLSDATKLGLDFKYNVIPS